MLAASILVQGDVRQFFAVRNESSCFNPFTVYSLDICSYINAPLFLCRCAIRFLKGCSESYETITGETCFLTVRSVLRAGRSSRTLLQKSISLPVEQAIAFEKSFRTQINGKKGFFERNDGIHKTAGKEGNLIIQKR